MFQAEVEARVLEVEAAFAAADEKMRNLEEAAEVERGRRGNQGQESKVGGGSFCASCSWDAAIGMDAPLGASASPKHIH
jgi:hypothetical protein